MPAPRLAGRHIDAVQFAGRIVETEKSGASHGRWAVHGEQHRTAGHVVDVRIEETRDFVGVEAERPRLLEVPVLQLGHQGPGVTPLLVGGRRRIRIMRYNSILRGVMQMLEMRANCKCTFWLEPT